MALDAQPDVEQVVGLVESELAGTGANQSLSLFARLLIESTGAEALAGYHPATIAAFVRQAFETLGRRTRGQPTIRVRASDMPAGAGTRRVATIETVNDDMPFLVDSVMGEVQAHSLSPRLVAHPIFKVRRDATGRLEAITGRGDRNWSDGTQESYIAVVLEPIDAMLAQELDRTLPAVLAEVRTAVAGWRPMLAEVSEAITRLEQVPATARTVTAAEAITFLRWLRDGHFTFLGTRRVAETGENSSQHGGGSRASAFGLLADRQAVPSEIGPAGDAATPVVVSKSRLFSRVHRRAAMDYITVTLPRGAAQTAERLDIVGLFTSSAYTQSPREIPLLRLKVASVVERSGHPPESHAGKALINVLETFPRDEVFQIDEARLAAWAEAVLDLDLRPRVRLLARSVASGRVSAIVYVPRDRWSTAARERISGLLAEAWRARVASFTPFYPEGPLVRIHFVLDGNDALPVDLPALETRIAVSIRTWEDQLGEALDRKGEAGPGLFARYRHAFGVGYQESVSVGRAIEDIARIERLGDDRPVAIDFHRDESDAPQRVRAAVYRYGKPIPLSERVPVLENLGFSVIDERTYEITPKVGAAPREVALHDMLLESADGAPIELDRAAADARLESVVLAVFAGEADNDSFNRLVLAAGADWREAALLRAYAAYMRQMRAPFGPRYIADTLVRHSAVTRDLLALFRTRHDPDLGLVLEDRKAESARIRQQIEAALAAVQSLDEDRILRLLTNLVAATVRTNYFQLGAQGASPALAFKLSSRELDGLPEPRPYREIWVYSPRVEGVHLRFAPIARGGIRWSDRAQDFRTEVLGLCKAQQVKNAVIVPQGAKGGFLPKQLPRSGAREEVAREGLAAYRVFIGSLLDITDNLAGGEVLPPPRVVRHDGDDPYLVVAADKGTATFSDTANEIAEARGFWLGDAFASGGSAGYDHKRMGITARGAWECVKRHFREMDRDIQSQPFTVVGVGDMSGDVFGNGMLLSPHTRLIAAFDHRDIFIDPAPDAAASLAERQRLFQLPRSSWQDYDKRLISDGGGVFSRAAKAVPVSPEMQNALGISEATLTPAELIRAILKAPCDLLWLGGIGTYIRATSESDEQAGDRANDAVRATAAEVRAKVVGEGANLGVTQRGRVELARAGCRIDTDFIDNSAGVNTSDQEVNIKIALAPAVAAGRLAAADRRSLLAAMTDDVASGALRNNYQQSLALSLAELNGAADVGYLQRLMQSLEARGILDRRLEALPANAELAQRQAAGKGLTRPELALLLSFAKIALTEQLLATTVPDEPAVRAMLADYFPGSMRTRFAAEIASHRLRREIVTTLLTNTMINRGGPAFVVRMTDETGQSVTGIAHAFLAARNALSLPELWRQIDALDGQVRGALQLDLYGRVQRLLLSTTRWFARHSGAASAGEEDVRRAVELVRSAASDGIVTAAQAARIADERRRLAMQGLPEALAATIAALEVVAAAPAIAQMVKAAGQPAEAAAGALFAAEEALQVEALSARAGEIALRDHFDRLAIDGAIDTIRTAAEQVALSVLAKGASASAGVALQQSDGITQARTAVEEVLAAGTLTPSRLVVAAQRVRDAVAS